MRTGNTKKDEQVNKKKNKNEKIRMIIWILIFIVMLWQTVKLGLYTLGKVEKEKMWMYNSINSILGTFIDNSKKEIVEENVVKFAGLGDIYATGTEIKKAKGKNGYDFTSGVSDLKDVLKDYDVICASLNTPIAGSSVGYSSKNIYNSPVEILDVVRELNVSTLATATVHISDKKTSGIRSTIKILDEAKINYTGISEGEDFEPIVIEKNNILIGFLSYVTDSDSKKMVNVISDEKVKEDVKYLKDKNVDFIVSYLNDVDNDSIIVNGKQKNGVELLFGNGVDVVFGTGAMAIQEKIEDELDLNEGKKHVYAVYSIGSVIGDTSDVKNRMSLIQNVEFSKNIIKDKKGNIKRIDKNMVVKDPTVIYKHTTDTTTKSYRIEDLFKDYESGKVKITNSIYNEIKNEKDRIDKLIK